MFKAAISLLFLSLWLGFSSLVFAVVPLTDHPQGALWWLQEAGQKAEAEVLEKNLTDILVNSPLDKVAMLATGVSDSFIVKFPNDVYAILKASDPALPLSYQNELAAYRLDRMLGLNMIPLTVIREIEGVKYSLQLFVPSKSETQRSVVDFYARKNDLHIFDFIIANGDRVIEDGHNVLVSKEGRLVGIDHGRSFVPFVPNAPIQQYPKMPVTKEFKDQLYQSTDKQIAQVLKDLLSEEQIREVQQRATVWKTVLMFQNTESKSYITPMTESFKNERYIRPLDLYSRDFHDYFKLSRIFASQTGDALSAEGLRIFEESRDNGSRDMLGFIALKHWSKFSFPVKKQILRGVWSDFFKYHALKRPDVIDDVVLIDPTKGYILRPKSVVKKAFFQTIPASADRLPVAAPECRHVFGTHGGF